MDSSDFPSEMISEILTRTPLKTLDICKQVVRTWKELIHEPGFMPRYFKQTGNVSGYFVQEAKSFMYVSNFVSFNESSVKALPNDMEIVASCKQGILCCIRKKNVTTNARFYVCKPSTNQWRGLPSPKNRYATLSVALMASHSSPLRFKIIRLSLGRQEIRCELFDSEKWAWMEIHNAVLPYNEGLRIIPAVSASGSVHWLTTKDNVLVFDEKQETFFKFPLPNPVHNDQTYKCKLLFEYQGRLAFSCETKEGHVQLWTIKDRKNFIWEKKTEMSFECLKWNATRPYFAGFHSSDVAFLTSHDDVAFYNLRDGSLNMVKLDNISQARKIFPYQSDMELVEFRGSRR